jgi:drug/metabolite transporter (DMT)-like permease
LSNSFVAVFLAQGVGLLAAGLLLSLSSEPQPGAEALLWAALAGVSGTFGLGCFYLALSRGTMGLVAPLTALLAAAWPATIALIGGSAVSPMALVGMGAALASVVLISLPDRRIGGPVLPTFHGSRRREWLLILSASLGIGGFFLLVDASHDAGGAVWWPLFILKLAGVASVVVAVLVMLPLGRMPGLRFSLAALLIGSLAGLGDLGGNLFFLLASADGELAIVIVVASLYPVTTAILARVVLHERLSPVRLAGVGLAIAGVALIGLGQL